MKKMLVAALLTMTAAVAMAEVAPQPKPTVKTAEAVSVPGVATPEHRTLMAERQLARFDKNKDGKVTLKEFVGPAEANFKKFDANKDGAITAEELAAAQKAQMDEFVKKREAAMKSTVPVAPTAAVAPVAPTAPVAPAAPVKAPK